MTQVTRRQLGKMAAAGFVMASSSSVIAAGLPSAEFDLTPYVHPELRQYLPSIKQMTADSLNANTLAQIRRSIASTGTPALEQPTVTERFIPGAKGMPDVRIYVINAGVRDAARPAILNTHGGGYILFDAKFGIRSLQEIALALDCVIVSVDYRLAPETKFPGSLEDNYAGLKWLYANADHLGVDRSRIAVMGESAGGGHAAMLAIAARDRGEIPLAYQALIYPMLDDRTGSTRKTPPFQGAIVWTPEKNRFGWSSLLGAPAGALKVPYGAVPARLVDLKGLPPAYIGVGSIDLFIDEDIDYARRLLDVGVRVDLNVVPGAFHGFDSLVSGTRLGKQFRATLIDALRGGLKIYG